MRKRSRILNVLHSQRAALSLLFLVVIGFLFALGFSEFYTKGEPREAIVAQAMVDTGNYILPTVYASEFAYKPPMMHWLMVVGSWFSGGVVTPFVAKLPSALALLILVIASFFFFDSRVPFRTSYLSALLLLTAFEVHRSGQEARVDMLLTMFIVLTLFTLYIWEDRRKLCGIPYVVPLLISAGILTKGPVALVLPMLIFGVYLLMFKEYSLRKVIVSLLVPFVLSLLIPSLWYYEAWKIGGNDFLTLHFGESISRFFHTDTSALKYPLGHEKPFWYPLVFLFSGMLPWSLLAFFAPWWRHGFYQQRPMGEARLNNMRISKLNGLRKVHLFSLVTVGVTILFYMIPSSKRGVYLLPLYPFLALILAEGLQQMAKNARQLLRAFSFLMASVGIIALIGFTLLLTGGYQGFLSVLGLTDSDLMAQIFELRTGMLEHIPLSILLIFGLMITILATFYQSYRRGFTKLAYCNVLLIFFLNLNIDGPMMIGFKEQHSAKRFSEVVVPIIDQHPAEVYAVSRLNERIFNLYGLAYYTGIRPKDFEVERPEKGYMMVWEQNFSEVTERFLIDYDVQIVASDVVPIQEGGIQLLLWIEKKK